MSRPAQNAARVLERLHSTHPDETQLLRHHLRTLRTEAAGYRLQLRTAQAELKDAQTLIAALLRQLGDAADLSLRAADVGSATGCGLSEDCAADRPCSCRSAHVDRRTTNPVPYEEQL